MKKVSKILLFVGIFILALALRAEKSHAAEYIWPVGGDNAYETYKDYDFYGKAYAAPYKDGKSGREYVVNNTLWPEEQSYYAACESHYGMDITGIYGHTYKIVSVCNGIVIATSGNRADGAGVNFIDRNRRQSSRDGGGYGNYIIIQEPSTGRCFLYAHLRGGTLVVKKGDTVSAGQEIATMGSSGDSGHMHLHFEIRKDRASTVSETIYGYHYLKLTNSNTNYDPELYIGSKPDVYKPVEDSKLVKISKDDATAYVRYLYSTALKREASSNEAENWANVYVNTGSIYEVTHGIFMSEEFKNKNGELGNLDFLKKTYEIILYRGNNYSESEMSGHLDKLNRGVWTREDYLKMLCNSQEFTTLRCKSIIDKVKEDDAKKLEEQRKAEEEKKKQEEEAKKKQEEETRKKEEEQKRQEEAANKEIEDVRVYVRYLYRTVLGRKALDSEVNHWVEQYKTEKSIENITRDIFVNIETESMSSYEFMKKIIEVLFDRDDVQDQIIQKYAGQMDRGEISRANFVVGVCSTINFKEERYSHLVDKQKEYEESKKTIAIAPEGNLSKLGDLDGDGCITAIDASLCLSLSSLNDKSDYQYAIKYADVDGDGIVEYEDAKKILDYYVEMMVHNIDANMSMEQYVKNN
ncbi:MAG: DUF4214 domain-containing protein [Clostridia bacterium]|nr:DUF4214 domain-containing protein [Clostridia bacterium]